MIRFITEDLEKEEFVSVSQLAGDITRTGTKTALFAITCLHSCGRCLGTQNCLFPFLVITFYLKLFLFRKKSKT